MRRTFRAAVLIAGLAVVSMAVAQDAPQKPSQPSAKEPMSLFQLLQAELRFGTLYREGKFTEALPLAEQIVEATERFVGPNHPATAKNLNNLGEIYREQGNYAAAEPIFQRALKIHEKAFGPSHAYTAMSLNCLAGLYYAQGNFAAAQPLYERAQEATEKAYGPLHADNALILNNLAYVYTSQGNYARAEPLYQRALMISEKTLGREHPRTALSINSLATLYFAQGNYAAAEPLLQRALKIREKALVPNHPDTAMILSNLALVYTAQGNYATAESLYQRALKIREEAFGPAHPESARCLYGLAALYRDRGDWASARSRSSQGFDVQLRHLEQTAAIQTEQQQFLMAAGFSQHLSLWLVVTSDDPNNAADAWRRVLAWKGLTTTRQAGLRQALKDDPTFAEFRQVSQQLSTVSLHPPLPPEDPKKQVAWNEQAPELRRAWQEQKTRFEGEYQRLEKELARKSALFRQDHQRRSVTPEDVVAALGETAQSTALVDLIEYSYNGRKDKSESNERRVAAFVARADGKIRRVELGPSKPIHAELTAWRETYGRPGANHDPGRALRRRLWEPLESHLAGIETVLVSPDGLLAQLPWGALPGARPGTYLIEERSIAVIPVPQMLPELLREKPRNGPPASLLVAGNIDYGGDPGVPQDLIAQRGAVGRQREGSWLQFVKLDNAPSELASIEAWHRKTGSAADTSALEGSEATEAAFRERAPRHAWLHLITHGFFAPPELSRRLSEAASTEPLAVSRETNPAAVPRAMSAPINPGLLSGLAFAGANKPPEAGKDDGILTALEVAALDLSKVDTVVLSACETGLGEVAGGEGLLGLQRSFQVAGAKTVVASLWKVPDAATSKLMQRFYENLWDKKMGKLAALREAQIWMLREGVKQPRLWRGPDLAVPQKLAIDPPDEAGTGLPPLYWAAFVLSGDWR